ncbi:BglG family transcription antiterminator [Amedibacterium intestinale]|uniref:BglG family transcription antiterminator n=1 Tax=Amedibacterium intestinale TaxID=2583452 RepID=UPI000E204A4A
MIELTKRQLEIVKILKKEKIVSSSKIGQMLNVSSKTIRNEISEINSKCEFSYIVSEKGSGYKINCDVHVKINDEDSQLNRNFLILRELLSKEEIDLYELAESLFISESTLLKSIQTLNEIIRRRNSNIQIQRNHNMLKLNGSEEERRQVSTYFLMHELDEYNFDLKNYADFFSLFDLNILKNHILEFNRENNIKMKDVEVLSFVMHVAVMMDRILQGNEIMMPEYTQVDSSQKALATSFYNQLKKWIPIKMSESEINYLACLFAGKVSSQNKEQLEELKEFVIKVLEQIKVSYEIDLTKDEELIKNLQIHLIGLKNRIDHNTFLNNPLIADIRTHFPIMYDISIFFAVKIQEFFDTRLQEGEIGYLTLHFMGAVERLNSKNQKKIVVISPIGEAVNEYIRKRLSSVHELHIEICEILSIFDVEKIEEYQPDLVVSLMKIPKTIAYPYYVCEELLSNQDIERIYMELTNKKESEKNNIEHFFDEDLFFCDQDFENKDDLLSYLCAHLYKKGYVKEDYLEKVLKREQIAPTAYGNLFSIPHPIEKCALENKICICILKKPILWNDKKVKIVFLFALTKEKNDKFDSIFTQMVSLLDNIEKVKKLIKTKTLTEFLTQFLDK